MLASSAVAFSFVKYLGAAYLIYLGVRTLISEPHEASGQEGPPLSVRRIYAQGLMVEALNPKVALFFLAFLPQFIDPLQGSVLYQTLLLGTIFVAIGVCSDSVYALVAGSAGGWLSRQRALSALRRSLAGCVYLGLGVATALSGDHGR
jgi:threonine/homoserine/homoserine lactone efflux protein